MQKYGVTEACGNMLQLIAQDMVEHFSVFICDLSWFTWRSLAFIHDNRYTLLLYVWQKQMFLGQVNGVKVQL